MERDDRAPVAPVASFFASAAFSAGGTATLGEAAAHHARVKRLGVGDMVRVTDGAGRVGIGAISRLARESADVAFDGVDTIAPPSPIHLRVPMADRDRMLWLAEKSTELGITTWQAVRFRRSASVSPRGEGAAFAEKVRARMVGALEQSGGAWLPILLPDTTPDDLSIAAGELPILLRAGGAPLAALMGLPDSDRPVILLGPEGGFETAELSALTAAGWRAAQLGSNTLRFETAGIAAVAVCRSALLLREI